MPNIAVVHEKIQKHGRYTIIFFVLKYSDRWYIGIYVWFLVTVII